MALTSIHTHLYMSGATSALTDLMPVGKAVRNVCNGVSVLIVSKGEARVRIDDRVYILSHGSIVALFPFHMLASEWKSDDFIFEYLYFEFDFMSDFPLMLTPESSEHFGANPYYQIDEKSFDEMTHCYDTLLKYHLMHEHPSRIGIVKAQLFTFVSEMLYRCHKSTKSLHVSREGLLTEGFFQLLHRYHKSERTLVFYAGGLCITTKHLSKVIRRTTGNTVYFWIEEFTVKEAKLLLRSTQATVTEIAEHLNFPNSSFFAKFFRRHAGCSPIEFRQSDD